MNVTVFEPGEKVPPDFDQFPETVKFPDGAVKVPLLKVKVVVLIFPDEPVKTPTNS